MKRYTGWLNEDLDLYLLEKRVDTTLNASLTELLPALAFNMKQHPTSVEDFKKFLYKLSFKNANVLKSFPKADLPAAKLVIEKIPTMDVKFSTTKIENALGITDWLYDLNSQQKIKSVIWGYRAKPAGIPKTHAGDIFIFFKDGSKLGVSLKAGTKKSKEPLKNTYVGTQYKNLGYDLEPLYSEWWTNVYSKIPGVKDVAKKSNYYTKGVKNEVTQLYVDYYVENETEANVLYTRMLKIAREHFCEIINDLKVGEFKEWVATTFNIQAKGGKKVDVPLVLVKAVGKTAEQKGDDIVDLLPLTTKFHAYLNPKSVQEYLIDIYTPLDKKTLKMTIRSDSGVRAEKKPGAQGRLGQYSMLKMQYSGVA